MKKVMDGNETVAYISYAFTEAAVIYPITPSSPMAEQVESWSQKNRENVFNQPVTTIDMQSEGGVAGAMHGLLKSGTLATTYTCSQGLLLMEPTIYKFVGELLPAVIHVSSRSLSSSALSIYGDHTDVMAVRQTGAILLSSASVQQAAYFATVAHLLAMETRLPVIHFFEGFDTSHEMQSIQLPTYEELRICVNEDVYAAFKEQSIRNDQPRAYGSSQTPDIFFQQLEINNDLYAKVPMIVQDNLKKLALLFPIACDLVDFYGADDAEIIIVLMGSVSETVKQVIDEQAFFGEKYGVITIHLYRPFPVETFRETIPASVKKIVVLDRTKESGSVAEPLLLDVQSVCYDLQHRPVIIGGRYGLGSKEVTPDHIRGVFFEAEKSQPKKRFTIGINDDVTCLSLDPVGGKDLTDTTAFQVKNWGFGSDGAVSCSKETVKIIGENTSNYVQGKFWFDPRKSGNVTISQLRFSGKPIISRYSVNKTDFVSCYREQYVTKYDLLEGLKENGIFLLNSEAGEKVGNILPAFMKNYLAQHDIQLFTIPADRIARKVGLYPHINVIMQICFFYLTNLMDFEAAKDQLKKQYRLRYGDIDLNLVDRNCQAMDMAIEHLLRVSVPEEWLACMKEEHFVGKSHSFYEDIQRKMLLQTGNDISVGTLKKHGMNDGSLPLGTTAVEKREIAAEIPIWNKDECSQCNLCSLLCPHGAIRPFLLDKETMNVETIDAKGFSETKYRIQVSPFDCTGCSICHDVCPVREKALMMKPITEHQKEADHWAFANKNKSLVRFSKNKSVRDSQFSKPLLEFSSACAGCGETAYVKLLTQMFGDKMIIANATGCSSIWGCTAPSVPYTTDENGRGPVWGNSLLENNAEYGFGMHMGAKVIQRKLYGMMRGIMRGTQYSSVLIQAMSSWCEAFERQEFSEKVGTNLTMALLNEMHSSQELERLFAYRHYFSERCQWIIGGDGWAYDIGFSGIDHILSKGENVNILILDNEGYSNTGGQATKGSPVGSRMKFSTGGKKTAKKNLAMMAMNYDNVYVAQISLGAQPQQTFQAFQEAVNHDGPSIVIAYSRCVLHGYENSSLLVQEKKAVEVGYWPLFRYTSMDSETGKPRLMLDSKEPKWDNYLEFLMGEKRFSGLWNKNREAAAVLLLKNEEDAKRRYSRLVAYRKVLELEG
ncbi:pyruvate:ferredoxin (flavodoxin) oxidoreductase [Evansella sp. AB-rgal1]|uniref:pyruvate:ferredoxin (flavodoxin) oxidoreductase n=1 Tax=Evansella sp. AB-rgal1 TaxID=3242696 RepID=UPI00359DC8F6